VTGLSSIDKGSTLRMGVDVPDIREVASRELAGVLMCSDPGAAGVQNRAKEAMARNSPRAGVVIENRGRSWHVPS
jgi:hypothetical protein